MKTFEKLAGKENMSFAQIKDYFEKASVEEKDVLFAARDKWFDETKDIKERKLEVAGKVAHLSAIKKAYVTRIPQSVPREIIGKMNSITGFLKSLVLEEEKALYFTNEFCVVEATEDKFLVKEEAVLTAGDKRFKDWSLYKMVDIETPF